MSFDNVFFFFSSRRRHTRCLSDWSSDVCSSDLDVSITNLQYPGEGTHKFHKDVIEIGNKASDTMQMIFGRNMPCQRIRRSEERRVGKECRSRWTPEV